MKSISQDHFPKKKSIDNPDQSSNWLYLSGQMQFILSVPILLVNIRPSYVIQGPLRSTQTNKKPHTKIEQHPPHQAVSSAALPASLHPPLGLTPAPSPFSPHSSRRTRRATFTFLILNISTRIPQMIWFMVHRCELKCLKRTWCHAVQVNTP